MENRFLCGGFGGARGFGGPGGVLEGHVEVLLLLMEAATIRSALVATPRARLCDRYQPFHFRGQK